MCTGNFGVVRPSNLWCQGKFYDIQWYLILNRKIYFQIWCKLCGSGVILSDMFFSGNLTYIDVPCRLCCLKNPQWQKVASGWKGINPLDEGCNINKLMWGSYISEVASCVHMVRVSKLAVNIK